MLEFSAFLGAHGVPGPLFAAFVSAYAQFLCGLLFGAAFLLVHGPGLLSVDAARERRVPGG